MAGRTVLGQDGLWRWIPEIPALTVSSELWQTIKEFRSQFNFRSPFQCVSCLHRISSFFDADQIRVGAVTRVLRHSEKPEHQGKVHTGLSGGGQMITAPLIICWWMKLPVTFAGPGCKECQHLLIGKGSKVQKVQGHNGVPRVYLDLTGELVRYQ